MKENIDDKMSISKDLTVMAGRPKLNGLLVPERPKRLETASSRRKVVSFCGGLILSPIFVADIDVIVPGMSEKGSKS